MTSYYARDSTRIPLRAFFRKGVRNPIVLLLLSLRKLFRRPLPPASAWARPENLDLVDWHEFPAEVQDQVSAAVADCVKAGMNVCFGTRGQYIGQQKGFSVVLLNPGGTVWATVIWVWVQVGSIQGSRTVLSFHSKLADGRHVHTAATEPNSFASVVPPEDELVILPPNTPASELFEHHRIRLADFRGSAIALTSESLKTEILHDAQRLIDHMVKMGILVPLSEKDVDRLRRQST